MYRALLLLIVILCSSAVNASPYRVTTSSEISHGNWTPIPEREMRAAAVDNALAEISKRGLFKLVEKAPADGELLFTISLIGEAQVVKMTIALHLDDIPSYLATTSIDIRNLDRQQIYQAFEYVGGESAKQLNAKVELAKRSPATPSSVPHDNTAADAASPMTLQRFNQAQSLKRQEEYYQARALFELLVAEAPPADASWIEMANDELRYALPKFEAQMLIVNGGFEPQQIAANQQRAAMLYRQILADNSSNPMRVVEINGQLDGLATSQVALKRAMQYQAMANSGALRMLITEHYMMMGEWPSQSELQQLLSESMTRLEIVSYQIDGQQMQLEVKDARSGNHVTLLGEQGEVRLLQ